MTDRKLLELAARAYLPSELTGNPRYMQGFLSGWNPLIYDGDALRLAVKLRIDVLFDGRDSPNAHVETIANEPSLDVQPWAHEALHPDSSAATRRAITRVAAEIGKLMKEEKK